MWSLNLHPFHALGLLRKSLNCKIIPLLSLLNCISIFNPQVTVKNEQYELINTCSVDNTINILNFICARSTPAKEFLITQSAKNDMIGKAFLSILQRYKEQQFDSVKKTWLLVFCKAPNLSYEERARMFDKKRKVIDLFSSEQERGLSLVSEWFRLEKLYNCRNPTCPVPKVEFVSTVDDFIATSSEGFMLLVNQKQKTHCDRCKTEATTRYNFKDNRAPIVLAYSITHCGKDKLDESCIPKIQKILKIKYQLIAYTLVKNPNSRRSHIFTVFLTPKGKVLYNGCTNDFRKYEQTDDISYINTVWLLKSI